MSIIVKAGAETTYTPHPEGPFPGVCCDVQDLGWEEHPKYGWKYKIRLVFFCGEWTDEKGVDGEKKRFPMVVAKKFTASLADKANLRAFCKSWRGGKDFDAQTLRDGFDFEKMLGAPALLQVGHFEWQGDTFAGIDSVMKLPKGMAAPEIPSEYMRLCDREDYEGPHPHPNMSATEPELPPAIEDDDDFGLPF